MPTSDDWPVEVKVLEQAEAESLTHDSVGPPSRDQTLNWVRQVEKEREDRLPFEDEES